MASNRQTQHEPSWLDRALDKIKPVPEPPRAPSPPAVDRTQWEHSVDAHKVNTLTVHDVGLIVFNETRSFTDRDNANDSLILARKKISHAIMNGDEQLGRERPVTAPTVEPSQRALKDPKVRAAYDPSVKAAREAYLDATDPTHGATHFKFLRNADRSDQKFGSPTRLPLQTQSGPFNNSYLKHDVHSHEVYINTYAPG